MECNQRKLALSFLPPAASSSVIKLIEHCDDSSDSTIVPFRMDLVVKPRPQTPKAQTQKPKKGPWADTKILWATKKYNVGNALKDL